MLTLALVVGPLIGQPVLLSFVTSESMEPTIEEGEAFVALPDVLAGDIEEGDVIVFQAQELQGGGLTTHRVVGETDEGYITQGDNNPFTDQDGDEPPVTEDRIVGVAWQPGGQVVTVPFVGTAILGSRALVSDLYGAAATTLGFGGSGSSQRPLFFIAGVLLLVAVGDALRSSSGRDWTRSRDDDDGIDTRYVAILLVAIIVVPANAAMLLPETTQTISMQEVAAERNADPGEEIDVGLSATNDGFVTMLFVLESPSDVTLDTRQLEVPGGAEASTTMYATVPPPGEGRIVEVTQRRYIVLLPPSLIVTLHDIHPLLALGVINAVLVFGLGPAPRLGIAGAALGTVIANVVAAMAFFALLVSGRFTVSLRLGGRQVDPGLAAEIVRVATPLAGMRLFQTFGRFPFLFILGVLGTPVVAAYAIGRRVIMLALMPAWGYSTAASTLVGQSLGRGAEDEATGYGWQTLRIALATQLPVALVLVIAARPIAVTFGTEYVDLTVTFIRVFGLAVAGFSVSRTMRGSLRGAGDTRFPLYGTTLGIYAVRLPIAALALPAGYAITVAGSSLPLGVGLGPPAVFVAIVADFYVRASVNTGRFAGGAWQEVARRSGVGVEE